MSCDIVSPNNAKYITVGPCRFQTVDTSLSGADASMAFTMSMSANQIGNIVTLSVDQSVLLSVTVASAALTIAAVADLPVPAATCYFPLHLEVDYASEVIGLLVINTDRTIRVYADASGSLLLNGHNYSYQAIVVNYSV